MRGTVRAFEGRPHGVGQGVYRVRGLRMSAWRGCAASGESLMVAIRDRVAGVLSRPPQAVAFLALVLVVSAPSATLLSSAVAAPGVPVELTERRTAMSQTFKNGDGTLTTRFYGVPVHHRDASGR